MYKLCYAKFCDQERTPYGTRNSINALCASYIMLFPQVIEYLLKRYNALKLM